MNPSPRPFASIMSESMSGVRLPVIDSEGCGQRIGSPFSLYTRSRLTDSLDHNLHPVRPVAPLAAFVLIHP